MSPQPMPNFEFVLSEPKTPQVLFEIFFPFQNPSPVLKITAEGISNLFFYAYVLSSIYIFYKFQRAIIRHHEILSRRNHTINSFTLFGINYSAIFLHCLWDNVLRYIFNTCLGLPYGVSFFYPVPRSPLEILPSWIFPNPTSEDLRFWIKFLLLLGAEFSGFIIIKMILSWYEARQQRQRKLARTSTDSCIKIQAVAGKFAETVFLNENLYNLLARYQVVVDGCLQGRPGDRVVLCEKGVEGMGTRNVVRGIKTSTIDVEKNDGGDIYGDIELASYFGDAIQYPLVGGKEFWEEVEIKVEQEDSDAGGEGECNILEESVVMVDHGKVDLVG